jgi:hypothetical protein
MANRSFTRTLYTQHEYPVLIDCNFIVDSQNGNGLGIRSLKGPGVQSVQMQSMTAAPTPPAGSPNLATAASFAILASSTITNTGATVITGNLGLYPGTSVTGFPPGSVVGTQHITDGAAQQAEIDATAAYNFLQSKPPGTVEGTLDGLTLTPGTYTSGSTMILNVGQTLALNGAGLYVFQLGSALTIGNGSTILLTGGATAANVYWQVGSSATIGTTAVFEGTIIANASVTLQTGASASGRMFALTGAVTLDTNSVSVPAGSSPSHVAGTPQAGYILLKFHDNYNRYFGGFSGQVAPVSGTPLTSTVANVPNVIVSLGTATPAQWQAVGLPKGVTPAIGVSFIATSSASIGGSAAVEVQAIGGSGIDHIEVVGDPNTTIHPSGYSVQNGKGQRNKGYIALAAYANNVLTAPKDGTVINLTSYLGNSSNHVQGE